MYNREKESEKLSHQANVRSTPLKMPGTTLKVRAVGVCLTSWAEVSSVVW